MASLALVSVAFFLLSSRMACAQATPAANTDGQIEMNVVHALDAAGQLKPDWITATTVQGVVTLSGTSSSAANKTLAATLASQVPGVSKVVNNLTVGNPQQQAGEQAPPAGQAQDAQAQQNGPDMQAENSAGLPATDQAQSPSQPANPFPGQSVNPANGGYDAASGSAPASGSRPGYPAAESYQQSQPYQSQYPAGPEPPRTPVTIEQGTALVVRTTQSLSSQMAQPGTPIDFVAARDVYAGGVLAIPRGATIHGEVTDVRQAGALTGHASLALRLDAVQLEGNSFPLDANLFKVKSPGKGGRTAASAFGGALLGALVGGAFGGGTGALVGGTAGGLGGTAASAMSHGPQVWIPSEAMMTFHLSTPLTVTPVSRGEAQRLASAAPGMASPMLHRRQEYPQPAPAVYPYGFYSGFYPGYYPGYFAPAPGIYFGRDW